MSRGVTGVTGCHGASRALASKGRRRPPAVGDSDRASSSSNDNSNLQHATYLQHATSSSSRSESSIQQQIRVGDSDRHVGDSDRASARRAACRPCPFARASSSEPESHLSPDPGHPSLPSESTIRVYHPSLPSESTLSIARLHPARIRVHPYPSPPCIRVHPVRVLGSVSRAPPARTAVRVAVADQELHPSCPPAAAGGRSGAPHSPGPCRGPAEGA